MREVLLLKTHALCQGREGRAIGRGGGGRARDRRRTGAICRVVDDQSAQRGAGSLRLVLLDRRPLNHLLLWLLLWLL